jgi:hypothetical protein
MKKVKKSYALDYDSAGNEIKAGDVLVKFADGRWVEFPPVKEAEDTSLYVETKYGMLSSSFVSNDCRIAVVKVKQAGSLRGVAKINSSNVLRNDMLGTTLKEGDVIHIDMSGTDTYGRPTIYEYPPVRRALTGELFIQIDKTFVRNTVIAGSGVVVRNVLGDVGEGAMSGELSKDGVRILEGNRYIVSNADSSLKFACIKILEITSMTIAYKYSDNDGKVHRSAISDFLDSKTFLERLVNKNLPHN